MTALTDILKYTDIYTPSTIDIDYHQSHMNILLEQLKRKTNIEESKVWDYIAVENDPFFSRRYIKNSSKLYKVMNNLSLYQQALTATTNQLYLARVYNFIPKNLISIIKTYSGLVDSYSYMLPTIKQQIPFNLIEQALLHDLLSHFDNGQATYNNILDMYSAILVNSELFENIKTGNLKSLLSLPISKFLPEEFSSILDTLSYLELLDEIFTDDTEKNNFNLSILNVFDSIKDNEVNHYVSNSYSEYDIDYDDPLGIQRQESMMNDFTSNIFTDINQSLISVYVQYDVPLNYYDILNNTMQNSFREVLIDPILDSGILLPDLTECSNTIKVKSNNDVVNSIKKAFVLFHNEILKRIPEVKTNNDSFDYLLNIKKNLEIRDQYLNKGSSTDRLYEIQNYVKGILNENLSDTEIDALYIKIKTVLKV